MKTVFISVMLVLVVTSILWLQFKFPKYTKSVCLGLIRIAELLLIALLIDLGLK